MYNSKPSLCDVYARCLDIVQRLTYISSDSHHGLTSSEFHTLEVIADALLALHNRIDVRQRSTTSSGYSSDLPF